MIKCLLGSSINFTIVVSFPRKNHEKSNYQKNSFNLTEKSRSSEYCSRSVRHSASPCRIRTTAVSRIEKNFTTLHRFNVSTLVNARGLAHDWDPTIDPIVTNFTKRINRKWPLTLAYNDCQCSAIANVQRFTYNCENFNN